MQRYMSGIVALIWAMGAGAHIEDGRVWFGIMSMLLAIVFGLLALEYARDAE